MTGSRSAGRRLGVMTLDQAVAGASNVLASLLAAHVLGISAFGLFGIVFLAYVLVVGCFRALVGEPLLIHPTEAGQRTGDALGTGLLLGAGGGVVVLLSGVLARMWSQPLGLGLIVLGVCLPLLTMQDLGRYVGFATGRPGQALILDVLWLALLLAVLGWMLSAGSGSLIGFILAWAGTGAAAGGSVFWLHRRARPRVSLHWLTATWGYAWRYLVSYGSTQSSALGASVALGAIAGTRALGAVNGALLLVRPFVTFQNAAIAAGVAEVARDQRAVWGHVRRTTLLTTAIALLNGIVLVFLPDPLGRLLLGNTWSATKDLVLPVAVQMLMMGVISGVRSGLLGVRHVRIAVRIDVVGTMLALALMIVGTILDGAVGALWGVTAGHTILAFAWWSAAARLTVKAQPLAAMAAPNPGG